LALGGCLFYPAFWLVIAAGILGLLLFGIRQLFQ
jgi:hypothetical protein